MEDVRVEAIEWLELDSRIKSEEVMNFTIDGLLYAKWQFFTQAASSSGRYHPSYALGVGGLLRHTKAALIVAAELFPLYDFSDLEEDYIISALTLHDIEKPSRLHPIEVKLRLEPLREEYPETFEAVIPLIETHMGSFDSYGKLPRPRTEAQHFVHLCDYIVSRKSIIVDV